MLYVQPQAQYQLETGICPKETRKFIFTSVSGIGQVSCSHDSDAHSTVPQYQDKLQFVSLLEMLLTFDPSKRADPSSCLQHPFITMLHLALQTASPWLVTVIHMCNIAPFNLCCCSVRRWIECMQVCCSSRTTHSAPPDTTPTLISPQPLLYTLDSTYLHSSTHQAHPLLSFPSQWVTPDYYGASSHSSLLVDTGYVSAESSPTSSVIVSLPAIIATFYPVVFQQDCSTVELVPPYQTPFILPPNSPYWLMLQQTSGFNRSRL